LLRANRALKEIVALSKNDKIECEKLDLADLQSVRKFAEIMNSKLNRLDLLINNAGIMMCPYWKTKDNFEMQFGTNHLGKKMFFFSEIKNDFKCNFFLLF